MFSQATCKQASKNPRWGDLPPSSSASHCCEQEEGDRGQEGSVQSPSTLGSLTRGRLLRLVKGAEESGWCRAGEDEMRIQGRGEAQVSLPASLGLSQPFGEGEEGTFRGGTALSAQRCSLGFIPGGYGLAQAPNPAGFLSQSHQFLPATGTESRPGRLPRKPERGTSTGALSRSPPSPPSGKGDAGSCHPRTCVKAPTCSAETPVPAQRHRSARATSCTGSRARPTASAVKTPPPSPVCDPVVPITSFSAPRRQTFHLRDLSDAGRGAHRLLPPNRLTVRTFPELLGLGGKGWPAPSAPGHRQRLRLPRLPSQLLNTHTDLNPRSGTKANRS